MMRKLLTLISLFSLLFQVFFITGLSLDYKLDLKSYAESCINKAKPELNCNGKCVLMQKIQQAQEKENGSQEYLSEIPVFSYLIEFQKFDLRNDFFFEIERPIPESLLFKSPSENSIFHPPRV